MKKRKMSFDQQRFLRIERWQRIICHASFSDHSTAEDKSNAKLARRCCRSKSCFRFSHSYSKAFLLVLLLYFFFFLFNETKKKKKKKTRATFSILLLDSSASCLSRDISSTSLIIWRSVIEQNIFFFFFFDQRLRERQVSSLLSLSLQLVFLWGNDWRRFSSLFSTSFLFFHRVNSKDIWFYWKNRRISEMNDTSRLYPSANR